MATIQRPLKLFSTRKYTDEVAADPDHLAPILAAEVDADIDTIYAAWNGGVDPVNIKPGSVNDSHIHDVSWTKVTGKPVIPGTLPPSGPAGGDLVGTYPNPTIRSGAIGQGDIAAGSVGTAEIIDRTVTSPKMDPSSGGLRLLAPFVWPSGSQVTPFGLWYDGGHGMVSPQPVPNNGLIAMPGFNSIVVLSAHVTWSPAATGFGCGIEIQAAPSFAGGWATVAYTATPGGTAMTLATLQPAIPNQVYRLMMTNATGSQLQINTGEFQIATIGTRP